MADSAELLSREKDITSFIALPVPSPFPVSDDLHFPLLPPPSAPPPPPLLPSLLPWPSSTPFPKYLTDPAERTDFEESYFTSTVLLRTDEIPRGSIYAIFMASILAIIANSFCLILAIVVTKLRKPRNAFFLHACTLDVIKSSLVLTFVVALLNGHEPKSCHALGAIYVVLVTTTAFNGLAVVVNELYAFTTRAAGGGGKKGEHANVCCVLFGVAVAWFASVTVNLGVAFLPTHTSFERSVGYCTFAYGGRVGNYLLHLLWIALVTLGLLFTVFYLRRLHLDVRTRAIDKAFAIFRKSMHLDLSNKPGHPKSARIRQSLARTVHEAYRNFLVLIAFVGAFIAFWYPLFLLTIIDRTSAAPSQTYRILTMVAWSHSLTTPVFFLLYNTGRLRGELRRRKNVQSSGFSASRSGITPSSGGSCRVSPTRPSRLDVTRSYTRESASNIKLNSLLIHGNAISGRNVKSMYETKQCDSVLSPSKAGPSRVRRSQSVALTTQELSDAVSRHERSFTEAKQETSGATSTRITAVVSAETSAWNHYGNKGASERDSEWYHDSDSGPDSRRPRTEGQTADSSHQERYSIPITELEQEALLRGRIKRSDLRRLRISRTCPAKIIEDIVGLSSSSGQETGSAPDNEDEEKQCFAAEVHVHTAEDFSKCSIHHGTDNSCGDAESIRSRRRRSKKMLRSKTLGSGVKWTSAGSAAGSSRTEDYRVAGNRENETPPPIITVHRVSEGCVVTTKLRRRASTAGPVIRRSGRCNSGGEQKGGRNRSSVVYWV